MELIYQDLDIVVAIKPPRVLSTDEPGGMPELVRLALNEPDGDIRTVHRLDRVVAGLMVLARNSDAASELSRQIRDGEFEKEYLAVIHGCPNDMQGRLIDLLLRDKQERKTYVVTEMAKGVQEAILDYKVLSRVNGMSKVSIQLITGRTHQIRAQFSGRGFPLVGDRKYSLMEDGCEIALWSHRIAFCHPVSKQRMEFAVAAPDEFPWNQL